MSNMSHCRFHNTLGDLRDCEDHISDDDLSAAEHKARLALIRLCMRIVDDYTLDGEVESFLSGAK